MTQDFIEEVIEKQSKVIVKFGAEWCGPCRMMKPILKMVEDEGIIVIDIDSDKYPELVAEFEVLTLPTMICYQDGKRLETLLGAMPKNNIVSKFK